MKRIIAFLLSLAALCLLFAGCGEEQNIYTVMLEENSAFTVEGGSVRRVEEGGSAVFEITFAEDRYYISNDGGARYEDGKLTVENVRTNKMIAVTAGRILPGHGEESVAETEDGYLYTATPQEGYVFTGWYANGELYSYANDLLLAEHVELTASFAERGAERIVTLHANGGSVYNSEREEVSFAFSPGVYLYPAAPGAWTYKTFYRDGYTAVEYNTAPDGSGTPVSFGSRVLTDADADLYVIWQRQTPADQFGYEVVGGEVRLTSYRGAEEVVAVPHEIGGLPVTAVGSGCFSGAQFSEAVLTENVTTVEPGAFSSLPRFKTLRFADSITSISDDSFVDCPAFSEIRVSAFMAPKHSEDLVASFVRRVEKLYSLKDSSRPSLLFYGGSGVYQCLDGQTLYDEFDGKFNIINCAQNANISAPFMFDIFAQLVNPRDVMVYMPEFYDGTYSTELTMVCWIALESYYDAWRCVDIRRYSAVFDSFCDYQVGNAGYSFAGRVEMRDKSYYDSCEGLNEYFTRDYIAEPMPDAYFRTRTVNFTWFRTFIPLLNELYGEYVERGAYAYQSFAAYYEKAYSNRKLEMVNFTQYLRDNLVFPVVSDPEEHVFPLEMIYDETTHLTTEGAIINSRILAGALREQLRLDGLY